MANTVEIVLIAKDGASIVLRGAKKELDSFIAGNVKAGDYAVQAGKKITTSYRDAQASALSLSRIIGVQMPEAVGKFLARTQTIAPILNSAFSGIAVLGLVTAISQLPKIIDEAASALTGWDDAAKKTYADQIALNDKYVARLQTTQAELGKMLLAQQRAAAGAAEAFNKSIPGQLSGATGVTGLVMRGLFKPPTAEQERATQTAEVFTSGFIQAAQDADRAIQQSIKWLEDFGKAAKAARLEMEALIRSIGAPSEIPLGFSGGSRQFHSILDWPTPPMNIGAVNPIGGIDFEAAVAGARQSSADALARAREFANSQAEIIGDAQLAGAKATFDKQKMLAEDFARSFSNSLGAVWDDMFIRGKNVFASLANFAAGIANSIGRSFFQAMGSRILGGSSGSGGLLGLASKLPGGLFGGAGGASILGSTAISGGILAPAAAPMAIGGIGGAGVAGGLTAAQAIPIAGAVAAAAYGLYRLFRHRTNEAPFSSDPFANQQARTYEFYAMDRLTNAIDRFTSKYDPVDAGKILQSAGARRALRNAVRTSQSEDPGWTMDTGAAFNGAL